MSICSSQQERRKSKQSLYTYSNVFQDTILRCETVRQWMNLEHDYAYPTRMENEHLHVPFFVLHI